MRAHFILLISDAFTRVLLIFQSLHMNLRWNITSL